MKPITSAIILITSLLAASSALADNIGCVATAWKFIGANCVFQ